MTPVTTFAGKTVAVFGLGGSGLASCRALAAGGAGVIASDDDAARMAEAARGGFATADLRQIDWSKIAALVLAPGVPLTHPAPHWSAGFARAAGVEVIGDIELFCRERRRHAGQAPFVAITGTNGKSTTTALVAHLLRSSGHDVQLGGNIGTAILSLEPPRVGRFSRHRDVVLSDRSHADARSVRRNPAQRQRGSHRSSWHAAQLRRHQGAAGGARPARRQRDHRGRRRLVPRKRRSHRTIRQAGAAGLGSAKTCRGSLCRGRADHPGFRRGRARDREPARHRIAARRSQCPERRLRGRRGACLSD